MTIRNCQKISIPLNLERGSAKDAHTDARPLERDRRAPLEKDRELFVARERAELVRRQAAIEPHPLEELFKLPEREIFERVK